MSMEYVRVPHCAGPIEDDSIRPRPRLVTSIPRLPTSGLSVASPTVTATSPTKQTFNLPQLLLSSSLNLPSPHPTSPRDGALLMSTREPLSLPNMTVNFRRFVSKSGPIFWLQDRIEEIVMWRKGWKVTCTWMAIYAFLCYFPRIFLLLPHIILISVLLATHGSRHSESTGSTGSQKPGVQQAQQPKEGTVDWYANLQAIQNLMGAVADLYDAALPFLPILSWATSSTSQLLSALCVSLMILLPVVIFIPLRPTLLCLGLLPLAATHPISLRVLPSLLRPFVYSLQSRTQRLIDNDNLTERHWFSDMREVELCENERWNVPTGWSKSNLKAGDRKPWTKGRDGWSDVLDGGEGNVSDFTFSLPSGYEFVETEDWRVIQDGNWEDPRVDEHGWMYTNDSWQDSSLAPKEEWKSKGMTRRRRWVRRIYLSKST